jgi:hypothetical protein
VDFFHLSNSDEDVPPEEDFLLVDTLRDDLVYPVMEESRYCEMTMIGALPDLPPVAYTQSEMISARFMETQPDATRFNEASAWANHAKTKCSSGSWTMTDMNSRPQDGVTHVSPQELHTQPGTPDLTHLVGTMLSRRHYSDEEEKLNSHDKLVMPAVMSAAVVPSEISKTAFQGRSSTFTVTPEQRAFFAPDIATLIANSIITEAEIDKIVHWRSIASSVSALEALTDITSKHAILNRVRTRGAQNA